MEERTLVSSGSPFAAAIGFSRAVRRGNIIAAAGTAPLAADGSTEAPGDVYRQARRCFEIVADAIAQAGGSLRDVVRTHVMLTDISQWQESVNTDITPGGDWFSDNVTWVTLLFLGIVASIVIGFFVRW